MHLLSGVFFSSGTGCVAADAETAKRNMTETSQIDPLQSLGNRLREFAGSTLHSSPWPNVLRTVLLARAAANFGNLKVVSNYFYAFRIPLAAPAAILCKSMYSKLFPAPGTFRCASAFR